MSNVLTGDKEFLAAMVAATLQDLRPPAGLSDDLMPERGADPGLHQAWLGRHTFPQKGKRQNGFSAVFLGDAVYDHYTARAVLNGMPFDARGRSFTLQEALLNLGVNEPNAQIAVWKKDFTLAAEVGDKMMDMIHRRIPVGLARNDDLQDAENKGDNDGSPLEDAAEMSLPYGFDRTDEIVPLMTDSSQILD